VSHTWQWPRVCSVRFTRLLTVLGAVLGLALALWLVAHVGLVSILSAIGKIHWWQFALICLSYPLVLIADSIGWHFSFPRGSAPFTQLLLARAAGEAVNAASAIAPVGGEPVRAWLVRPWVPYEESVPSIVVAKTVNTLAQVLLISLALGFALATLRLDRGILLGMAGLLVFEIVAIAIFVATQVWGGMSGIGRLLKRFGMSRSASSAQRMDQMLVSYYTQHRGRLVVALVFHFIGRMLGAVEVVLIMWSLRMPVSPIVALTVEAIGAGVRFATFFLPGSLGALEGANAAAFSALGMGASAGLAFILLRRARQVVWIGLGLAAIALARLRAPHNAAWARPLA
jgi:uncharacterized protein (TIRG00374 family)